MVKMTKDELLVFDWLGKEDSSAYGECMGAALDGLVSKGIAELGPIPPGRPEQYRRVWLTDYGWEVMSDMNASISDDAEFNAMNA